MKLSKGQILYTVIGPVTILGCGNGVYRLDTTKGKRTIPVAQAHADIEAGRAHVADMSMHKPEETSRTYLNICKRRHVAVACGA